MEPLLAAALAVLAGSGVFATWALWRLVAAVCLARHEESRDRTLRLLALFAPGVAAAAEDPRALLSWQAIAVTARSLFPGESSALDRACGARFPFSAEQIQSAHARWTAEWLAWEQTHDSEYKLKAAEIEATLRVSQAPSLDRARLEAVERQKLDRYQRRYEEYVRVGKALQALML